MKIKPKKKCSSNCFLQTCPEKKNVLILYIQEKTFLEMKTLLLFYIGACHDKEGCVFNIVSMKTNFTKLFQKNWDK